MILLFTIKKSYNFPLNTHWYHIKYILLGLVLLIAMVVASIAFVADPKAAESTAYSS